MRPRTRCTREDTYIATLAGALNQINHGATTLVDWATTIRRRRIPMRRRRPCRNPASAPPSSTARQSPTHAGSSRIFRKSLIRAREIERLLPALLPQRDGKLSLGMAILGPHYSTLEVSLEDFRLSREFGLVASMHQGGGPARAPAGWDVLESEGLSAR